MRNISKEIGGAMDKETFIYGDIQADRDRFSNWLKDELIKRNLSRSFLANESGISKTQMDRYFHAESLPRPYFIRKISQSLNISESQLLTVAGYPPDEIDNEVKDLKRYIEQLPLDSIIALRNWLNDLINGRMNQ